MDSLDIAKACLRRWYVFFPVLIVALVLGFRYAQARPASYDASGAFVFVYKAPAGTSAQDQQQRDPRDANPLSSGSLLRTAVMGDLTSTATQNEIKAKVPGSTGFTAEVPRNAPQVVIKTTADSQAVALNTIEEVLKIVPQRTKLAQDRAGAPAISQLTTYVTSPPDAEIAASTSTAKMLIGFGVAGLLAGAALSLILERVITSRRRRNAVVLHRRAADHAALFEGDSAAAFELEDAQELPRTTSSGTTGGHQG